MIKTLLESKIISINIVLLLFFSIKLFLKNKNWKEYRQLEYLTLLLFLIVPLLNLDPNVALNLSVTSLGGFIAYLVYPQLIAQLDDNSLKQKKRAIKKIPFLFIVIFFTLSNHVEPLYVYTLAGLSILFLKRSLASAFFSWPLLLSGFFENSAIMVALVTISFAMGIYLFEDKNA
ncbi:hypothetical protein [Halobacteriovorax sp.]|uniref:hypothetical protein n=1 Tax=Halobacteriovorax sp. TaxID=2020862 RepID=UPI00356293B0